jgi:hypothetical protein
VGGIQKLLAAFTDFSSVIIQGPVENPDGFGIKITQAK